jgi:hypothetical protein
MNSKKSTRVESVPRERRYDTRSDPYDHLEDALELFLWSLPLPERSEYEDDVMRLRARMIKRRMG